MHSDSTMTTDAPTAVEDNDIQKLSADVTGLLDALGEKNAAIVGHDWARSSRGTVCCSTLIDSADSWR